MWSVWDKKSPINGKPADCVLATFNHLKGEETIFLKTVNGHVTNVEGKSIIAYNYNLDPALPDDEFIAAYEAKLAEPDEPAEPTEPEPDETATYAELAQVYKEGVNGLE